MRERHRILIVVDDPALRRSLAEQLDASAEFVGRDCDSAAAPRLLREERSDAVLLDGDLPDAARYKLCRLIRQAGRHIPIVMMTAAGQAPDPTTEGSPEADDYLAKPFRLSDLLARLRVQLARSRTGAGAAVAIGGYTFRPGSKLMVDDGDGRTVRLTDKEAAILEYLHRAGRVIDRDTLLGEVWGYNEGVTTHTLETHVYRLRRKIERDPGHAEILVTEAGGYRLVVAAGLRRPLPRKSRAM
ncbi:MAG TPA: response regulator transcription factor [Stellaceae bacterium]|nr:response regulator transcription factor [Stellaceae bacterium]